MKILFYIILSVLFPFQMIMGQTGKDSILFRGNIVYDGDASEATFLHELYIKHNPKQRYPIVCDSDFSIKCMRGDTQHIIGIECSFLHVWAVWHLSFEKHSWGRY